ncbi:MAG: hypothetical protein P1V97_00770 [Planctomycetota bacterium]|nr:hypothetical protein [Planctomycetota bacterium]
MKKLILSLIFILSLSSAAMAEDLKTLKEKRLKIAEKGLKVANDELKMGTGSYRRIAIWSKRHLDARFALAKDNKARLKCLNNYIAILKGIEEEAMGLVDAGALTGGDVFEIQFHLVEAKIALAKFKKTMKKSTKK